MQDTRTRTLAKPLTVDPSKPLRLKALLFGGNAAWIGAFWPLLVGGETRAVDISLAFCCLAVLLPGTLISTPPLTQRSGIWNIPRQLWRAACLLLAFPIALATAIACRPEAGNLRIFGPPTLTLLGLSLCAYGAFAAVACAAPCEALVASHVALGDQPRDAPPAGRGRLQTIFVGLCCVGACGLVFVAPAWGGSSALASAWGEGAMAGGVLTAVVGAALGVTTLTVFLSAGLRQPTNVPPRTGAALRATWFLFLALLGAITYFVIKP
jgi:hypothetical protein